tara:strand:+ start:4410 stop:4973 length:564 start_codon:yes stop_codon:yes gene_type:complete
VAGIFGPGIAAARIEDKQRALAAQTDEKRSGGHGMRFIFGIFPLLIIPVAIYNLMAFLFTAAPADPTTGNAAPAILASLDAPMLSLPMVSGATWTMTGGDLLVLLALIFLFAEILKSTSTGTATIMNHAVSMILFIVCLVEFLLFSNFATSIFFILTMTTLLDVLAGVVVTIVSARRDFAVGEGFSG